MDDILFYSFFTIFDSLFCFWLWSASAPNAGAETSSSCSTLTLDLAFALDFGLALDYELIINLLKPPNSEILSSFPLLSSSWSLCFSIPIPFFIYKSSSYRTQTLTLCDKILARILIMTQLLLILQKTVSLDMPTTGKVSSHNFIFFSVSLSRIPPRILKEFPNLLLALACTDPPQLVGS